MHASPSVFLALRFALATALVGFAFRGMSREAWRLGAVLALLFAGGFVVQTLGLATTTPARSAFITGLSTPLVPVVAYVLFRARPAPPVLAGIGLALGGTWLLTDPAGGGLNRGDVLTLGCAALFAAQITMVGRYARRVPPLQLLAVELLATTLVAAAAAPVLETPRLDPVPRFWGLVALSAATGAWTFWAQLRAQAVVSEATAALVFVLEPVAASVASWLVLGEVLAPAQLAGAALILLGTVVPVMWRPTAPAAAGPPARS